MDNAVLCHWSASMCHVMCQNEATRVSLEVLRRGQLSRGLSISPLAGYNCLSNLCPRGDFARSISRGLPALPPSRKQFIGALGPLTHALSSSSSTEHAFTVIKICHDNF